MRENDKAKAPKKKLTPWQRIIRAADKGVGIRLTADEVWSLSYDSAIRRCAENDDESEVIGYERHPKEMS